MAIRNASVPSLLDVMNVLDLAGKLMDIAEILTQKHEFLDDMGWQAIQDLSGRKKPWTDDDNNLISALMMFNTY